MKDIVYLMRPHQWIKNFFIFTPLFFSFSFNQENIIETIIAFILFSILASSVYVLNDILDKEDDKKHPTKRYRPIASGKVNVKFASIIFGILSFISLLVAFLENINFFFILVIYFILNIFYSLKLKHIVLVDIFVIATGFVLRVFAGSIIIDINPSMWIVLITFLLATFLALAKRRDDVLLSNLGEKTRKNIDGYNLEFINASMVLMAAVVMLNWGL